MKEAKEKLHPDPTFPLSQVEHHSIPLELHVLEYPVAFVPHSKAWNIKDMTPKARLGGDCQPDDVVNHETA